MAVKDSYVLGYCFLLLLIRQAVNCYDLRIEPRRVTVRPGQKVTILCRASAPLTVCSFLLPNGVVADLSRGARTPATAEYRYYGTGLEYGQCGITLSKPPVGFNNVACRGWAEKGGWKRNAMFLRVTSTPTLSWNLQPDHAIVLPGESLTFLCRSSLALTDCRLGFMREDRWASFTAGAATPPTSELRYLGNGLESGHCGVTMMNVKESMSGDIRCVGVSNERWAGDFMMLVVAKSPDAPDLEINGDQRDGGTMEATCAVSNARPAANLTWYLDNQVVSDAVDATPADAWYDYELQSTVQRMKMRVTDRDHGRELKCVASHIALFDYVNQDTKVIDVRFSPRDLKLPTRQSNMVIGSYGMLKVEIRANPQPILTWSIGGITVKDDDPDATDRYKAVPATNKGLGKWEITLHIRAVTAEDLDVEYVLNARNQLGGNTFRISMPRSEGAGGGVSRPSSPTAPVVNPRPTQAANKPKPKPGSSSNPAPKDDVCGYAISTVPLIVNGNATQHGQWPWTAAIFAKKPRSAGLEFQCGGTLIDRMHVVTAAHCIAIDSQKTLTHNDLIVILGKYDLTDWTEANSQLKKVKLRVSHLHPKISRIHVHPRYEGGSPGKGSDIAVLTLTAQVSYTAYVRPICMWNKEADLDTIIGKHGVVVGWGRFSPGDQLVSDVPRKAFNLIVSQEECLRSNTDFLHITGQNTFCAGNRDGSGPCNGDSGSGLVLPYETAGKVRWFLRGLVSLSLRDRDSGICDLTQYLVYTDVSRFTSWIKDIDIRR